jgi:hypothetical protein
MGVVEEEAGRPVVGTTLVDRDGAEDKAKVTPAAAFNTTEELHGADIRTTGVRRPKEAARPSTMDSSSCMRLQCSHRRPPMPIHPL